MLENQVRLSRLRAAGTSMIIVSVKAFPTAGGIKSRGGEKCLDNFVQSVIREQKMDGQKKQCRCALTIIFQFCRWQ